MARILEAGQSGPGFPLVGEHSAQTPTGFYPTAEGKRRVAPRHPGLGLRRFDLLARQLLAGKEIALVFEGPEVGAGMIEGDPDLLCQVLLGLLDNAVRVSPRGGHIVVAWRETEAAVEVSVCDSGPGIPEPLRREIFEPFFTTRPDGHGLGLAVARQIVAGHGGEIVVEAGATTGACFRVILPTGGAREIAS